MEIPKKTDDEKIGARLGSLLLLTELISNEQMTQAMDVASALALPLGKVLVMLGFISSKVLVAAIELQSLQRDRLIEIDTIKQALKVVAAQGVSVNAALTQCGWSPDDESIFTKLGELLREARIITEFQLKSALEHAARTQMPLGRVLVLNRYVNEAVLWSALNAQVLLRDGRIKRLQAINALKAAHKRHARLNASSAGDDGSTKAAQTNARKIKLGDLLVLSGLLSESNLRDALETCLLTDSPIGEILIQKGLMNKRTMDAALKIQDLVSNDVLPPQSAGMVLRHVAEMRCTIPKAVASIGSAATEPRVTVRLGELFKLSGILTDADIQDALGMSALNTGLLGKILVATGQIGESTLQNGLRCQFLVQEKLISEEQAVLALNYCQRMQCNFDEALKELGVQVST